MQEPLFTPTDNVEDAKRQINQVGELLLEEGRARLLAYGCVSLALVAAGVALVVTRSLPSALVPLVAVATAVPIQRAFAAHRELRLGRLMAGLSIVSGYTDEQVIDYVNLYARRSRTKRLELRGTYDREHEIEAVEMIIDQRIARHKMVRNAFFVAAALMTGIVGHFISIPLSWIQPTSTSLTRIMLMMLFTSSPLIMFVFALISQQTAINLRKLRSQLRKGAYTAVELFQTERRYALDGELVFVPKP